MPPLNDILMCAYMLLKNKVAVVTGASRGIGKAVAAAFLKEGAKVALCARNAGELERTATELHCFGIPTLWKRCDVSSADDVKLFIDFVMERWGVINILVNNASLLGPRAPLAEYPVDEFEKVMRVNVNSIFYTTKYALPVMLKNRNGSIINVSSGVGRVGKANWGAYAASKFAVEGLTQVTANEVKESGIRANAVNPGGTRTKMRAEAYPDEDPMTLPAPEDTTDVFVYLASDLSRDVTGQSFDARGFKMPPSQK